MGLTAFPKGVSSFGMPVLGSGDETLTTGNVFFVDSGHVEASDANAATDPSKPAATIDGCIAKCTASNGDIIFVMPGHDENPTSSITMDVAGVWVRGIGWGDSRPRVTFGALAATVAMSAAGCRISNIVFDLGTVAATVTNCFNITADGCIVEKCQIEPHATSQFTNFLTATDAEHVVIRDNVFQGLHTASGTSGVVVDGCDDLRIERNIIMGHFTEHALDNTTPASVDEILRAVIVGNVIHNDSSTAGDFCVELDAAATGIMVNNALSGSLALASNVDFGNMRMIENYLTDAVDVHAVVMPTTAAA